MHQRKLTPVIRRGAIFQCDQGIFRS
jgi:hypothetical protein